MTLISGTRLGPYEILGPIGAGGMGEVYRARDLRLGREVALKVLPAEESADEPARRRLVREAQTASRLNHPNICTIHEVGESDGLTYIAMERVEGTPLDRLIAGGGLPAETVVRYGVLLADAVACAHDQGVIHRDLKCANVVVTPDGRVKVLDFGLAKSLTSPDEGDSAPTQSMTRPGAVMGTPAYLAPEVLRGHPADPRSDLWSLGVMLYEMASGGRPFRAATALELGSAILNDPPEALPARVPPGLAAIIARCLEKDPLRRYRRAGEVRAALEAEVSEAATEKPRARSRRARAGSRSAWLWGGVAIMAAAALLALDAGGVRKRLVPQAGPVRIASLAVLPLENFSRDPDQEYFADSMTEQLIATLAQVESLRVISRTSVMGFKGTTKPIPEIGRTLDVDGIVEGSVHRSGDRVRITAQLIRVASDEHVWARTYERDLRDVLALQQEVADAIVEEMRVHLSSRGQQKTARLATVSPEAYDLYLRGVEAYRQWDRRGRRAALELLTQALEIDSTYAPAWAALGFVRLLESGSRGRTPGVDHAQEAVDRALALDPDLAEAHWVKGNIARSIDWDWVSAEREYRRAIEAAPSLFEAHHSYSHLLMDQERVDESLHESRTCVALDPLNTAATLHLGWHYLMAGEPDRAIAEYLRTIRLDPSYSTAHMQLVWAYLMIGRYPEADQAYRKYADLTEEPDTLFLSALIAARRGRVDDAARMLSALQEGADRGEFTFYDVAVVLASLGRNDEAFGWLDRSIEKREAAVTSLRRDPFLDALRADPRFPARLRRVGIPAAPGAS